MPTVKPLLILSPASSSFRELAAVTETTKLEYAHWHKCETWFPDYPSAGADRWWDRLTFCLAAWKKFPDHAIFFMGADAMIVNMRFDVRAFLNDDFDLAAVWDANGLQSDVMLLNPTDNMLEVLQKTFNRREQHIHLPGLAGTDQAGLVTVLSGLSRYVNDLPVDALQRAALVHELPPTFNRYWHNFRLNDFVFHACNMVMSERLRWARHFAKQIVRP